MRTFHVPNVLRTVVKAGSLALVVVAPVVAAEPPTSVGFVDRDTIGWRNPLRAGSASTSEIEASNSLRQTVSQVSYEEDAAGSSPRNAQGLQLRPHAQQTGIFSGVFGSGRKTASQPRPTSMPAGAGQPQFRSAKANLPTAKESSQSAFRYMPSFKSSAARRQAKQTQTAIPNAAQLNTRPAPAAPRTAALPSQRVGARTGTQATYNSAAAAAQAYQHNSMPAARTAARPQTAVRPSPNMQPRPTNTPLSRPSLATKPQASLAPATPPDPAVSADPTTPAAILTQAHQMASAARTEADFSKILSMCQQVPARAATAEETAFGRQLAAWALNRRGQLKARVGNNEAAMADFEQAIRIDAKCWRALHNRGVLLAQAGQFEPAFDDFHKTIELNPDFAKAYANRGALYVLAGELEPALADYQHAAGLDPKLAIAERGCGRVCHMLGRIDESLEHLSRAIELAPRDANALASRADLLTDLGEYPAAAYDYEQALAINPRYADAYRGSAWLLATCPDGEIRNPGVALERAQKAVALDRQADATTFDTLAAAQASVGDFQAAAESIRKAIELAPPSERSVYQDRMQMYRQSKPYRIEPIQAVQQAGYEQ
jgi:tetratricopeptide (TPR) repeat protein